MNLTVRNVDDNFYRLAEVEALYTEAFPENERAPFSMLVKKAKRDYVDFLAYYDGDLLAGMVYLVHGGELSYIFYIAVSSALRGRGYGSAILQALKTQYPGQSIFLAMEELDPAAPNYGQRLKRRGFYLANGFSLLGHKVQEGPVIFDLAGTDDRVTGTGYLAIMRRYVGLRRLFLKIRYIE